MRILTFQDKIVINAIRDKEIDKLMPVYECKNIFFSKREEDLFNMMITYMRNKLNIPKDRIFMPIWGWVVPKDIVIDKEYIDTLFNRYIPKCHDLLAMELEVPNDLVVISNYSVWESLLFKLLFEEKPINIDDFEKLFVKQKGAILQASIPFIHRNHIVNMTTFENYTNDFSQTDKEIKELIRDNKINVDETGQWF